MIVLDKSGSMSGDKWKLAVDATVGAIEDLGPTGWEFGSGYDRCAIVLFDHKTYVYDMFDANKKNIHYATKWLKEYSAGGATNIKDALYKGLDLIIWDTVRAGYPTLKIIGLWSRLWSWICSWIWPSVVPNDNDYDDDTMYENELIDWICKSDCINHRWT